MSAEERESTANAESSTPSGQSNEDEVKEVKVKRWSAKRSESLVGGKDTNWGGERAVQMTRSQKAFNN